MKMRNISVRKKIMLFNFMMVLIPVVLILVIVTSIVIGLRMSGNARRSEIALLWPDTGPSLSIQLAVSSLRAELDRKNGPKFHEILEACEALEEQGIQVAVTDDSQVFYITKGTELPYLIEKIQERYRGNGSALLWDEEGFAFRYRSVRSNLVVIARGDVPLLVRGSLSEATAKNVLEIMALLVSAITIAIIIVTGVFLSRRLSRKIVKPLQELRRAAGAISQGNLDYAISVDAKDELGIACREFDAMRVQLKEARQIQERYEQNRKELIVGISHDLSTPLTTIKGYTSGLLDGIANTQEKRERYLSRIYQTTCTMESLVERLFLFSKLDLGQENFCLESVQLQDYFADYIEENRERLAKRGVNVNFETDGLCAVVAIDRIQFQRVIENIVENTIKYKQNEVGQLIVALKANNSNEAILLFSDDGCGVSDEDIPNLFESFFRTDRARTNVSKGSGMGLSIVKKIILTMGGAVWAEKSRIGGLAIGISLPIQGGMER